MAEITKVPTTSISSILPPDNQKISGLYAGEALVAGDLAYLKNDGKFWKASGAAATAPANVIGIVMNDTPVGEAVTVAWDIDVRYGSGLTPGARYFLSGTVAGGIADAASTGGTLAVAFAVDTTRIHVLPPH